MSQPSPVTDDLERPAWACLLHLDPSEGYEWQRADSGYRTCESCLIKLREVITDIRRLYGRLNPTPDAACNPMSESGTRAAPGFNSKPAANLHIVTMSDPRSKTYEVGVDGVLYEGWVYDPDGWAIRPLPFGVHGPVEIGSFTRKRDVWWGSDGRGHSEQARPPRSIPKALVSLAGMIAEDWEHTPPAGSVDHLCHWLDVAMDYVTKQDWCTDVDEELRSLRAQLRPVGGEGKKHKILSCPNTLDEGEHTRVCGANIYEPDRQGVFKCYACKRKWARNRWHGDGPEFLSQLGVDYRPQRAS